MSGGGLTSLIGFWNQQQAVDTPPPSPTRGTGKKWEATRSLPSSPAARKWEAPKITVKEWDAPKSGLGGREGFARGLELGREEGRRGRREGGEEHPGTPSPRLASSPFTRFRQLEDQAARAAARPPTLPTPGLQRNASLPPSPRPASLASPATPARSGSGAKELILTWVQTKLQDYPIPVTNFSSCWNDGRAFAALIHVFYPDNFDWHALDPEDRRHNFTLAFDKAEELADICPLLEVDDMVKYIKPDWKCVFTYVQSFYRRFRDDRSPQPRQKLKAAVSEAALPSLATPEADKTTDQGQVEGNTDKDEEEKPKEEAKEKAAEDIATDGEEKTAV